MMFSSKTTASLLFVLSAPCAALAFGPKRVVEHQESSRAWASSQNALLSGLYFDDGKIRKIAPELLGEIQAGPFLVSEKGSREKRVVLTMIDGKKCRLLEKSLADLERPEVPASLKKITCEDGRKLRAKAQAPKFDGYLPLSSEGRAVLERFHSTRWRASREVFFGEPVEGEEEIRRVFSQTLSLQFVESLSGLDIFSNAVGLNTKSTDVMREYPLNRLELKRLLERRLSDGSIRFVAWGEKSFWPTNDQNRIALAAINPLLMSSSERLTVYPNNRICLGASCWKMSELETARLLYANYLLIEFNPASPERLRLRLMQVEPGMPEAEVLYRRDDATR